MNTTFKSPTVEQTQTAFAPITACRIPTTAPTLIASLIKEGNKKFKRMTRAQKRVEIAKDALMQILAKRTIVVSGTYVEGLDDFYEANPALACNACAKGALFLAKTRRFNKEETDVHDFFGESYEMPEWPEANWHLIEVAFEGSEVNTPEAIEEDRGGSRITKRLQRWEAAARKARDFHKRHYNEEKRLIAILKNIIKNNGTFVP